jgi:hypothetical protein
MNEIVKCLCGALPIIEQKPGKDMGLFKYRCPNCMEKELPWLGQWRDCGALQEWNRIAQKNSYRKRTLEYNDHGVCIAAPSEVLEWRDKKKYDHFTIKIYTDNGRFYYCCDYWWKTGGGSCGLWIGVSGFPTIELLKENIRKRYKGMEGIEQMIQKLMQLNPVQNELF